jgi:hypothetical protein
LLFFVLCLSLSAGVAQADVYSWTGAGSGAWNDAADWTGGGGLFPGVADTARIDLDLNPTININGSQSVGGLDFTNGSGAATSGTVSLNTGTLTIGSAASVIGGQTLGGSAAIIAPVNVSGGTLAGALSITGNVTSIGGTIAPSNNTTSAHTLTVVGNVTLDHGTTVNFNLASPGTAGSGISDWIDITGNLSLDGTLNVNALPGFDVGTYRLVNYTGSLTGAGLSQGALPAGIVYTIDSATAHQVNLSVAPAYIGGDTDHSGGSMLNSLDIDAIYHHFGASYASQWKVYPDSKPVCQEDVTYELTHYMRTNYGDTDLDRYVDWTDFQTLLDHMNKPGAWASGDFNGDGMVDALDFMPLTGDVPWGIHWGDANADGKVDFADFQALLDHWQASTADCEDFGWSEGNFNLDGKVDFADFQKLLDNWNPAGYDFFGVEDTGYPGGWSNSQVPEPASLSLLALGGLAMLRRKK